MRGLILFRHAKAAARTGGEADRDRPLTAGGAHDAARMGAWLAEEGLAPSLALVSPARRTRETWQAASAAFPGARMQLVESLYDAGPAQIDAAVSRFGDGEDRVLVVGHNPGLPVYAVELMRAASAPPSAIERLGQRFATASAAVFAFDAADRPQFEGVYEPESLPPLVGAARR